MIDWRCVTHEVGDHEFTIDREDGWQDHITCEYRIDPVDGEVTIIGGVNALASHDGEHRTATVEEFESLLQTVRAMSQDELQEQILGTH